MSTSGKGGLWMVKIHVEKMRLWIPIPAFVLLDLLESIADLCEVILPRFGQPNYGAAAYALVASLVDMDGDEPLVDIQMEDVSIYCKRMVWR